MLDEFLEWKQYTTKDVASHRLLPGIFFESKGKNKPPKYNGFVRAITILARYELFHKGPSYSTLSKKERKEKREHVKQTLNAWLFPEENAASCLSFTVADFAKAAKKETLDSKTKEERKKRYNDNSLYDLLNWETPSLYAISYDRIIADAIFLGPLKCYLLALKESAKGHSFYQSFKDGKMTQGEVFQSNAAKDKFLKYIAAFLLSKKQNQIEGYYVPINKTDLANWMQYKALVKQNGKGYLFYCYDMQTALFDQDKSLYHMNEAFLKDFDFQLLTVDGCFDEDYQKAAKAFLKTHPDTEYLFFRDTDTPKITLQELSLS